MLSFCVFTPFGGFALTITFDDFTVGTSIFKGSIFTESGFNFTQLNDNALDGSPTFVDIGGGDIGIEDRVLDGLGQDIVFTRVNGGNFLFDSITAINQLTGSSSFQDLDVRGFLNGSLIVSDRFQVPDTLTSFSADTLSNVLLDELRVNHIQLGNDHIAFTSLTATIPEPSTYALFGLMAMVFGVIQYRWRKTAQTVV